MAADTLRCRLHRLTFISVGRCVDMPFSESIVSQVWYPRSQNYRHWINVYLLKQTNLIFSRFQINCFTGAKIGKGEVWHLLLKSVSMLSIRRPPNWSQINCGLTPIDVTLWNDIIGKKEKGHSLSFYPLSTFPEFDMLHLPRDFTHEPHRLFFNSFRWS